jgi:hypothetical protein
MQPGAVSSKTSLKPLNLTRTECALASIIMHFRVALNTFLGGGQSSRKRTNIFQSYWPTNHRNVCSLNSLSSAHRPCQAHGHGHGHGSRGIHFSNVFWPHKTISFFPELGCPHHLAVWLQKARARCAFVYDLPSGLHSAKSQKNDQIALKPRNSVNFGPFRSGKRQDTSG